MQTACQIQRQRIIDLPGPLPIAGGLPPPFAVNVFADRHRLRCADFEDRDPSTAYSSAFADEHLLRRTSQERSAQSDTSIEPASRLGLRATLYFSPERAGGFRLADWPSASLVFLLLRLVPAILGGHK